jgi:serine/threonine-protein kinase RIO1
LLLLLFRTVTFMREGEDESRTQPIEADYDDEAYAEEQTGWSMNKPGSRLHKDIIKRADGSLVTKHDPTMNARMNAIALSGMEGAGDLQDEEFRVPNAVYNKLKMQLAGGTIKGVHQRGRVSKESKATREGVLDPRTEMVLFKMEQNGVIDKLNGVCKTGKEASIFHAIAGETLPDSIPQGADGRATTAVSDYAIKVFRTTLNEFSNRAEYFDGDARYAHKKFNKQTDRRMFKLWAEKELRNLVRAYRKGLWAPQPFVQREHVLVMEFLGTDGMPSPQLREVALSDQGWQKCYTELIAQVFLLYRCCSLVHGDLSEYNVLYHNQRPYLIDFGQAVDLSHEGALKFLTRDLVTVNTFFRNKGAKVLSTDSLIPWVTDRHTGVPLAPGQAVLEMDCTLDADQLMAPLVQYIDEALATAAEPAPGEVVFARNGVFRFDADTMDAWQSTKSKREYLRAFNAESDARLEELQAQQEVCTSVERDLYHRSLEEDERGLCRWRDVPFWQEMWDQSKLRDENCPLKHTPVGPEYQVEVDALGATGMA